MFDGLIFDASVFEVVAVEQIKFRSGRSAGFNPLDRTAASGSFSRAGRSSSLRRSVRGRR